MKLRKAETEFAESNIAKQQFESNELADIINSLPVVVFRVMIKPSLQVEYLSEGVEKTTGFTFKDFLADPEIIYRQLDPADLSKVEEMFTKVVEGPQIVRWTHKDGRIKWIAATSTHILDAEGNIIGFNGMGRDITPQMENELILRQSDELHNYAANMAKIGGWEWDLQRKKMYWTPECYQIHELDPHNTTDSPDDLINISLSCYDFKDRDTIQSAFNLCVKEGVSYEFEFPFTTAKGSKRWIRTAAQAIYQEDNIIKVVGVIIDITERKRNQELLLQSEERLRLANKAVNDVVWDWDAINDVQNWNESGIALFGWEKTEFDCHNNHWWSDRLHPEDKDRVITKLNAMKSKPTEQYWQDEYRFRKGDGSYACVADRAFAIRDEKGKMARMVGTMRDISELKRHEQIHKIQYRIASALNATTDISEVGDYLMQQILKIEGIDAGGLYLYDNNTGFVTLIAHAGLSERFVRVTKRYRPDSANVAILKQGKPFFRDAKGIKEIDLYDSEGFTSICAIPFVQNGEPVASLNLGSKTWKEFTPALSILLQSIMEGIGATILRLKTGESLKQSEQQFRTLFEEMLEGFALHQIICDEEGIPIDYRFMMVNPAFERLTGLKAENIIGKRVLEVLPNTEKHWIDTYGKIALGGPAQVIEDYSVELKRHYRSIAYSNQQGYFAVIIEDVTDRRRLQEELEQTTLEQEILLDNIDTHIWYLTDEDTYGAVNKAHAEFFGFTKAQMANQKFHFFWQDRAANYCQAINRQLFESKQDIITTETVKNRFGEERVLSVHKHPHANSEGKIDYIVCSARDITELSKTRNELIVAKEKAEESNRLKSSFLAAMNHELRTPLNHILGFSQVMQMGIEPEENISYAEQIYKSGENLLRMIQDIFDLALADRQLMRLRKSTVRCFDHFLENKCCLEEIFEASNKTDTIHLKFSPDLNAYNHSIMIDAMKVNQILSNLYRNAVKFTDNGEIEFGFSLLKNGHISYFVRDTGIGIDPQKQQIIFDTFRQADEGNTRLYGGVGIGLAISKRLTELMGGTLSLESKLGEGTCFTLDLPVELGAKVAADEDVKSTEDAMPDFSQYTILVVEDDPVSMSLHTAMLGVTKAQLLKATNGQEAVDIVAANGKIDAVLMDQKMPVMDGNTATEIIKELRPNLPVVLLTANIRIGFHESIVQEPFDLVLAKPLNRVLLLKKLAEILRT